VTLFSQMSNMQVNSFSKTVILEQLYFCGSRWDMSLKKGGGKKKYNYCHVELNLSFPKQPHSCVISFCSQVNTVSICSTFIEDNHERVWYLYTPNSGSFWFPLHFNTFFFLLGQIHSYFTRYNYILIYRPLEQIFCIHTETICWLVIIHI
jgi:hypothetical protein